MLFDAGKTYATREVANLIEAGKLTNEQMSEIMVRHMSGDWGELCDSDKESNERALIDHERLLSVYMVDNIKLYVITEWDRSATTILLSSEY